MQLTIQHQAMEVALTAAAKRMEGCVRMRKVSPSRKRIALISVVFFFVVVHTFRDAFHKNILPSVVFSRFFIVVQAARQMKTSSCPDWIMYRYGQFLEDHQHGLRKVRGRSYRSGMSVSSMIT